MRTWIKIINVRYWPNCGFQKIVSRGRVVRGSFRRRLGPHFVLGDERAVYVCEQKSDVQMSPYVLCSDC
jgi:hypothetical protein